MPGTSKRVSRPIVETGEVHLRVDGLGDTGAVAVTSDRRYVIYATPDFEIVLLIFISLCYHQILLQVI